MLLINFQNAYDGLMPNYFGFLTIMGLYVFLHEGVDVTLLEVGIGGQYDSTNLCRYVPTKYCTVNQVLVVRVLFLLLFER